MENPRKRQKVLETVELDSPSPEQIEIGDSDEDSIELIASTTPKTSRTKNNNRNVSGNKLQGVGSSPFSEDESFLEQPSFLAGITFSSISPISRRPPPAPLSSLSKTATSSSSRTSTSDLDYVPQTTRSNTFDHTSPPPLFSSSSFAPSSSSISGSSSSSSSSAPKASTTSTFHDRGSGFVDICSDDEDPKENRKEDDPHDMSFLNDQVDIFAGVSFNFAGVETMRREAEALKEKQQSSSVLPVAEAPRTRKGSSGKRQRESSDPSLGDFGSQSMPVERWLSKWSLMGGNKKLEKKLRSLEKKIEQGISKPKTSQEMKREVSIVLDQSFLSTPYGKNLYNAIQQPFGGAHNKSSSSSTSASAEKCQPFKVDVKELDIKFSIRWKRALVPIPNVKCICNCTSGKIVDFEIETQNTSLLDTNNPDQWEPFMIVALKPENIVEMVREGTFRETVRLIIAELDSDIVPVTPLRRPSQTSARSLTQLTFVIEGLKQYLREQRSTQKARTKAKPKGRKRASQEVESVAEMGGLSPDLEAKLQDELMWLTLDSGCQVHETKKIDDTAEYIYLFSEVVATSPYKDKNYFTGFCADGMERKTSKDPKEIWKQQLAQITDVSENIAGAIVSRYPTFSSLYSRYMSPTLSVDEKRSLLSDIMISSRRVGPAVSGKIFRVLTDPNPSSLLNPPGGTVH